MVREWVRESREGRERSHSWEMRRRRRRENASHIHESSPESLKSCGQASETGNFPFRRIGNESFSMKQI